MKNNEEAQSSGQPKPRMKWITSGDPVRAESLADVFRAHCTRSHFKTRWDGSGK